MVERDTGHGGHGLLPMLLCCGLVLVAVSAFGAAGGRRLVVGTLAKRRWQPDGPGSAARAVHRLLAAAGGDGRTA